MSCVRVEAGHAQPAFAQQWQNSLKLLRAGPDAKRAVIDALLRWPAGLQRLLGLVQVVKIALERYRGKAQLLA